MFFINEFVRNGAYKLQPNPVKLAMCSDPLAAPRRAAPLFQFFPGCIIPTMLNRKRGHMSRRKIKRKDPNRPRKPKGDQMRTPRQIMQAMAAERKKRRATEAAMGAMKAANAAPEDPKLEEPSADDE